MAPYYVVNCYNEVMKGSIVVLLRTRHTASRQFIIPREIREKYGIRPLDEIEIIDMKTGDDEGG